MATSPKLQYKIDNKTPGPGKYKAKEEFSNGSQTKLNKKGFSFNRSTTRNHQSFQPGPGSYSSDIKKNL